MIIPPVGTVHEVEANDYWILVESWSKSYYLLQILSCFSHGILPLPHIKYKHNKARKSELQPSQLLPTTPCILVGQVKWL